MDGVERVTSTIYNPVYGNPFYRQSSGSPIGDSDPQYAHDGSAP